MKYAIRTLVRNPLHISVVPPPFGCHTIFY